MRERCDLSQMKRRAGLLYVCACACAVVMSFAIAGSASAASGLTLLVTTTSDNDGVSGVGDCATTDTSCTLRDAVNAADVEASGTTDTIALPSGTYVLDNSYGPLNFTSSATVIGSGASSTLINGLNGVSGANEIMTVASPASVGLDDVTLENGNSGPDAGGAAFVNPGATLAVSGAAFNDNASNTDDGGAIADQGTLTVNDSSFTGNSAFDGGAILVQSITGASATVTDSTLSGNQATATGGAIYELGTPSLTVSASAVIDNTSGYAGGGIADSSSGPAPFSLTDSTIAENTADDTYEPSGDNLGGGGLYIGNNSYADQIVNDTIADNTSTGNGLGTGGPGPGGGGDVLTGTGTAPVFENTIVAAGSAPNSLNSTPDCSGNLVSQGYNLTDDDSGTCEFTGTGDITDVNPDLGPLQSNGGPTETVALLAGSPAIDAGANAVCPATDQRGVARPQGSACDIGAYESAPPVLGTESAPAVGSTTAILGAPATNPDVQGGTVEFRYGTTTSYGSTTAAQTLPASTSATPYAAELTGLTPNTVYHYRVVATDPDGTVYGVDEQFTTAAATTTMTTTTPPVPGTTPANKFTFGKVKVSSKGKLSVSLGAPDAGSFSAKATFSVRTRKGKKRVTKTYTFGTGSAKSSRKGTVQLTISLKGSAAKELKKPGSAKVTITVTFTPTGGASHKESTTVTVKRSRKGKYS